MKNSKTTRRAARVGGELVMAAELGLGAQALTSKDVCEIIQVAASSKVISLRFGDLQLTFKETVDTLPQQVSRSGSRPPRLKLENDLAEEAATAGRVNGNDSEAAEAELELLGIENPLALEQHILSGDSLDGDGD